MELRELRVLVAVVEHGSVVRAAKVLHVAPSTVSHALTTLEGKLGVRLFDRLTSGMVPTDACEAMLGPTRRALREIEAARIAATARDAELSGQLTLVSVRMLTVWLADLVVAFHRAHPGVFVNVLQSEREEHIPELVRKAACDLGIMRVDLVPDDLTAVPVTTFTGAVIVPADHPLASHASVDLRELNGLAFVSPSARLDVAFEGRFAGRDARPNVVAEVEDPGMIFELVRAGLGVAFVPMENVDLVTGRGVVALPIEPSLQSLIALVGRGDGSRGPVVDAFVALAIDRFVPR